MVLSVSYIASSYDLSVFSGDEASTLATME